MSGLRAAFFAFEKVIMNFVEYAPLARRTLKELPFKKHLEHMALGITGEMGELLDALKKADIYGKPLDKANVLEEIGDICWYVINLCEELDVKPHTFEAIREGSMKTRVGYKYKNKVVDLLGMNAHVAQACYYMVTEPDKTRAAGQVFLDKLWAVLVIICDMFGVELFDAFDVNIKKLATRYGDKYSDYAALNRDLDAERAVLEGGVK